MVLGFILGYFWKQEKNEIIMRIVLTQIYKNYLDKRWPIVSRTDIEPAILNVAFPDESIVYYVNSFKNDDRPVLRGRMPPNIYFWSLTLYDQDGKPFQTVNDSQFPDKDFIVSVDKKHANRMNGNVYEMKSPPQGVYCIIQRVYKSAKTPDVEDYLPIISGLDRNLKDVSNQERIEYSNKIQNLLYTSFKKKVQGKTPEQVFPGVNTRQFFLPSEEQVSMAFPNPSACYLLVFPKKDKVIRVYGKLPDASAQNRFGTRFVSFMASDLTTTATNESLSMETMITDKFRNYTLFVAYSPEKAYEKGYDPTRHNLLIWDETNPFPVLIYRILSTEKVPSGIFAIDNTDNVDGSVIQKVLGEEYPSCF